MLSLKNYLADQSQRLLNEWRTHGKIIIGVDYDDTVSPWTFRSESYLEFYDEVLNEVRESQQVGAYVVCFTGCLPDRYEEISSFFASKGIKLDAINETPLKDIPYGRPGSKIYANIYLDDRGGLREALTRLIDVKAIIQEERNFFLNEQQTEF